MFPDNEKKTKEFQELQEAYSILSDTKKRAEYSQMSRNAQGQGPTGPRHPFTDYQSGMSSRNNTFTGNSYGAGSGGQKSDPLHEMMQEMLRAQAAQYQKFGPGWEKEAHAKGRRWDRYIWRLVIAYIVLWIVFGNLQRSAARQQAQHGEADPDRFEHRASLLDSFTAARMRDPNSSREKEYLKRQREVRELMETYNEKDEKKKDDTMDKIDNNLPE